MKKLIIFLLITLVLAAGAVGVLKVIAPTHEHAFGEWETKTPATCTEAEVEVRKCECEEEETRVGDAALGHEWTTPDVDLCEVESTCGRCGETQGENVEHSYGEWETKTPASCTVAGEEVRKCACGAEETRPIEKLDHSFGEWETKTSANCTDAEVEVRKCECGEEETREGDPATGHTAVSISAILNKTDAMKYDVLTAADFTVTATCECEATYNVTEGITLENATLEVEGENTVTVKLGELSTTVTVNAAKFNVVINATVAEDTYVRSGSSYKEKNYADAEELYAYGDGTSRVLFRINFSDIINSKYFESFKEDAKVQITFTVTTGIVDDTTAYTFKVYPVTDGRLNANFSEILWSNYNNDTYQFGWNNANDIVKKTDSDNSSVDGNVITLTFTYREIEECVDAESGDAIFVFAIWQSGTKIGSIENTTEANRPTVQVIFSEDHAHAYIEQVVEEKYFASSNCEEKAKYYLSCSCGEAGTTTFEYGEVIDHSYGEWQTKTPATCTEAEVEYRVCSNCPKEETQTGDAALDHDMQTKFDETNHWTECSRCDNATEPVVHFGGEATENEQAVCEGCGQSYGGTLSHVHSYGEWETKTAATCLEAEVQVRKCTCGVEETQTGEAALGHNMETKYDDNNHWTECSRCDNATEAVAHFGGEATIFERATCETCGQHYGELAKILVDDTYVDSGSGNTGKDYSENAVLRAQAGSVYRRTYLRLDLSYIINNSDLAAYNATAKLQFTFTLTSNSAAVDDATEFTLYTFNVTDEATKNVDFSALNWGSVKSADNGGSYPQLAFNGSPKIMDAKTTSDDAVVYDDTAKTVTLTINYSDIESYIDSTTGYLFIGFSTNVGLRVHSLEATDTANRPNVEYIYGE